MLEPAEDWDGGGSFQASLQPVPRHGANGRQFASAWGGPLQGLLAWIANGDGESWGRRTTSLSLRHPSGGPALDPCGFPMVETYRKTIAQLTDREYALYRAIAVELEDLQRSIRREDYGGLDVAELAVAMRDRRFLVEWLRELRLPPASDFNDCGLTDEVEIQILKDHS
jgi:hypothetical protein